MRRGFSALRVRTRTSAALVVAGAAPTRVLKSACLHVKMAIRVVHMALAKLHGTVTRGGTCRVIEAAVRAVVAAVAEVAAWRRVQGAALVLDNRRVLGRR